MRAVAREQRQLGVPGAIAPPAAPVHSADELERMEMEVREAIKREAVREAMRAAEAKRRRQDRSCEQKKRKRESDAEHKNRMLQAQEQAKLRAIAEGMPPRCGKCTHCLDMKMYGGPGKIRQSCKDQMAFKRGQGA